MKRQGLALLALAFATACASAPKVARPELEVQVPEGWGAEAGPAGEVAPGWWSDFGDAQLSSAVKEALASNYDLVATAARVEQAAARARIAGADLKPTVSAGLTGSRRRQNFIGLPIPGSEGGVLTTRFTNFGVSLDLSWELDLWGRLSARASAALADFEASESELAGAQLSLAGQTVKAWFAVAEAAQQVALAEATVASFESSTAQVRRRYERGLRPALDLRLSLANLAGAQAALDARRQALDAATRQLEILRGRYPGRRIETPDELPDTPPAIPAGLPAHLIARRPDLAASERRLAAAHQRVAAARRDLYPRISLTASGGTSTKELGDLVKGDFGVWSLLGNILQPIFQGGRLRANVNLAEATGDEALALYASAALRAYFEVESALEAEGLLAEREAHLATAAQESRAAERLADERYRSGLERFITVLESQRRAFQAESEWLFSRRLRLENRTNLYLALGGGFQQPGERETVQLAARSDSGRQGGSR